MNRTVRLFLIAFAIAMGSVGIGEFLYARQESDYARLWFEYGSTVAAYLVLALGCLLTRDYEDAPRWPWLTAALILLLSQPLVLIRDSPFSRVIFIFAPVPAYLALTGLVIAAVTHTRILFWRKWGRGLAPAFLTLGAILVLSTLFLNVTDLTGWQLIVKRAPWVTAEYNGLKFFGPNMRWLQPVFWAGYPMYVVALVGTAWLFCISLRFKFSVARGATSPILRWLIGLVPLINLWFMNDVFWGWHYGLSQIHSTWAAAVATSLWVVCPVFGLVLFLPIFRGNRPIWRLKTLMLFQLPIVAFDVMMMPALFGSDSLELEGLGTLLIGLQFQSWACLDLLVGLQEVTSPELAKTAIAA